MGSTWGQIKNIKLHIVTDIKKFRMVKKRSPVKLSMGTAGDVDTDSGAKKQKVDTDSDNTTTKQKNNYNVADLLTKVEELVENFNYELALQFSERAHALEPQNTKVLETKNNTDDTIVELISYESRMTLLKILIEVDLCDKVETLGVQLLEENEDDIRIWYYIGLSKSLM